MNFIRKSSTFNKCFFILAILLNIISYKPVSAQQTNGLPSNIITENPKTEMDFPVVSTDHQSAPIRYDCNDHKGVIRAIGDLQNDIERVTGIKPALKTSEELASYEIVIGTLGNSKLIDQLVSTGKLDTKELKGKWESFVIKTISNPQPSAKQWLVIAGSDKRGTIYGIYELSKQLGVSPWYWWADVPAQKHSSAYVQ